MSTVKTNNLQIGQSVTATNNATWYQPSTPDGTVRLGVGNAGATSSDILIANSSGNLGLGVTPSAWGSNRKPLQMGAGSFVAGRSDNATITYLGANFYYNGTSNIYLTSGVATLYAQDTGGHYWYTAPSGTAGNAISFTQAMTLDASGRLIVGTTSALGSAMGTFSFLSSSGNTGLAIVDSQSNNTANFIGFRNGSGQLGSITNNGNSAVAYNTSSDQRLKTNITPAGSAIQSILDFPVDQFDWISSGEHQDFGGVAQKVLPIIPEMVSVPADPDEMWGIDWSKAVPRLIKTIQELSAELNELKQKVNA